MESSTISKSKQNGKEVETAVPTIGEQQAEAEKRSFVKSCFPSEQLFPGSSTKFSWLFATIEPRCFHLSSAENLSARRLYRIRQLARPLRVFFPFFFFGFITHARPTSPLGSFTFLRASIIVQGPLLTQIRVHFVATTWPGSSRLSSISVLYRCFSVFTLHPAPGYSMFLSHASLHCCRPEFRARVRVSR